MLDAGVIAIRPRFNSDCRSGRESTKRPTTADLKECQHYADQVNSGQIIAVSSALTGLFGGLLSMAVGDESSAKKAAGAGVTAGGAKGLAASEAKKAKVARQCLRSRGYIVYD